MSLRKIVGTVHLLLGFLSGTVMFVVCLTGALWVFNEEISRLTGDMPKVAAENKPLLPPSQLSDVCEQTLGKKASRIVYTQGKPAAVSSWSREHSLVLYINPYSGKALKTFDYWNDFNFFVFILDGHRFLWLPWKIGRPIVNYGTLTFIIVLVSGLFIWFPRTRKALRIRTWFKWNKKTGRRRKIYDLHTIVGFYVSTLLLILALTGMVWGIKWYSNGLYRLTAGGKNISPQVLSQSDTSLVNSMDVRNALDKVFCIITEANPNAEKFSFTFPNEQNPVSVISASVFPNAGKSYNCDNYLFDRYSLKQLPVNIQNGIYADAGFADKLRRMNYDIHTGAIGGLPGKILAFLAAIIGASLPVTGVYILWKKRMKRKFKIL
jgi:uncharacterized iron-regulated membrane protein